MMSVVRANIFCSTVVCVLISQYTLRLSTLQTCGSAVYTACMHRLTVLVAVFLLWYVSVV